MSRDTDWSCNRPGKVKEVEGIRHSRCRLYSVVLGGRRVIDFGKLLRREWGLSFVAAADAVLNVVPAAMFFDEDDFDFANV